MEGLKGGIDAEGKRASGKFCLCPISKDEQVAAGHELFREGWRDAGIQTLLPAMSKERRRLTKVASEMRVRLQKGLPNYTGKLCGGEEGLLSQGQLETDNGLIWGGRDGHLPQRHKEKCRD